MLDDFFKVSHIENRLTRSSESVSYAMSSSLTVLCWNCNHPQLHILRSKVWWYTHGVHPEGRTLMRDNRFWWISLKHPSTKGSTVISHLLREVERRRSDTSQVKRSTRPRPEADMQLQLGDWASSEMTVLLSMKTCLPLPSTSPHRGWFLKYCWSPSIVRPEFPAGDLFQTTGVSGFSNHRFDQSILWVMSSI